MAWFIAVVAGIVRAINMENMEEEKLAGFDYGLDVLVLGEAGAASIQALKCWAWMWDPRAKFRLQGTRTFKSEPWRRLVITQTLELAAPAPARFPDG